MIIEVYGPQWYAEKVVAPLFAYEALSPSDVHALVEHHMEGLPEPLRAECLAAVASIAPSEGQP